MTPRRDVVVTRSTGAQAVDKTDPAGSRLTEDVRAERAAMYPMTNGNVNSHAKRQRILSLRADVREYANGL